MQGFLANLLSTFFLGLLTPLTAVCVLPLYPGYLSFLSQKMTSEGGGRGRPLPLGLTVVGGAISFMTILGLVFTTLLEVSLTGVVGIISPIAFGALTVVSLLLIFNVDIGRLMPGMKTPKAKSPFLSAFLFGFFFGMIVLPCNPGLIAAFFAKTLATSTLSFLGNFTHFIVFGIGLGFPLLFFSAISAARSQSIIRFLSKHKTIINRAAGGIMLIISLYYLIFVFRLFSFISTGTSA
jgi:cytochrome c-type biogenesis protein